MFKVCVIGVLEREEKETGTKRYICRNNDEKLPKCGKRHQFKDLRISIQEGNSNKINSKKIMPGHIIIKFLENKNKEKYLKAAREK